MLIRTAAAAAIFAAAALTAATGVAAHASSQPHLCASLTESITRGESASHAVKTVAANIPKACGFTISGNFDGAGFSVDGWGLLGTSTYGAGNTVHLVYLDQGMVLNVYRAGGGEYLRVYEDGKPTGGPDLNTTTTLRAFGVPNAVIKAAGFAKWIKLDAAQQKKFNADAGVPLTATAFASDVARGSLEPWRLGGTKTLNGVKCTVLVDPVNNSSSGPGYLGESLYVNSATGLPVELKYVSQDSQQVSASFGNWNRIGVVTPPPASKVVAG